MRTTTDSAARRAAIRRGFQKAKRVATALPPLAAPGEAADQLARLPRGERRALYLREPGTARPEVAEELLTRAWALRSKEPRAAESLAWRALECGFRMLRTFPCRAIAADLCAEALSQLAHLARLRYDFVRAAAFWPRVGLAMRQGTGDRRLLVDTCHRRASLARAQRNFPEAIDLLRLALKHQAELEDPQGEGTLRVSLAMALHRMGKAEEAYDQVILALEKLDPDRDHRLIFRALHNSLVYMADMGPVWVEPAAGTAKAFEFMYRLYDEPQYWARYHWVRGRLYAQLEFLPAAVHFLEAARRNLKNAGLTYEAALAGLDLALVYAKDHDTLKVRALAAEMYPVFIAKEIPREAAASLALFAQTAPHQYTYPHEIEELLGKLRALHLC